MPTVPICTTLTYLSKSLKDNLQLFCSAVALHLRSPQPPAACGEKYCYMSPLWQHTSSPMHAAACPTAPSNNRVGENSRELQNAHWKKKKKRNLRLFTGTGELALSCLSRKCRCCHFGSCQQARTVRCFKGCVSGFFFFFLRAKFEITHAKQMCGTATPIYLFLYLVNLVSNTLCVLFWVKVPWWILNEAASLSLSNTEGESCQRSGKSRFHMNPRVVMGLSSNESPWSACMPKPELIPTAAWTLLSPEEAGSYRGGGQEDTESAGGRESGGGWAAWQNFT